MPFGIMVDTYLVDAAVVLLLTTHQCLDLGQVKRMDPLIGGDSLPRMFLLLPSSQCRCSPLELLASGLGNHPPLLQDHFRPFPINPLSELGQRTKGDTCNIASRIFGLRAFTLSLGLGVWANFMIENVNPCRGFETFRLVIAAGFSPLFGVLGRDFNLVVARGSS
ncbi:hypothetical protein B0I37DRAFT_88790 [Chaetomium sp. MPI-CAGE-AT-0009]|nr:hypothetical protein B0I37DRAFT_88790 [Chaetomium sp. MPI-CAGE-AT-0009]